MPWSRRDPAEPLDEASFLNDCLALGKQYSLQRRIKSAESVSKVLFATALKLAENRELTDPGGEDLAAEAQRLRRGAARGDPARGRGGGPGHARRSGLID